MSWHTICSTVEYFTGNIVGEILKKKRERETVRCSEMQECNTVRNLEQSECTVL